jgi:hypothetical protein
MHAVAKIALVSVGAYVLYRAFTSSSLAVRIVPGASLAQNAYARKGPITQLVIHESVTTSEPSTVRVLQGKGLGVHYSVDRDGTVRQHVPDELAVVHAGDGHNAPSVAVEIVTPYYVPSNATYRQELEASGSRFITATWADKGAYVTPPLRQLESAYRLVRHLASKLRVPYVFPGMTKDGFQWGRIPNADVPGIMAHTRWAHSDGAFVEHYIIARGSMGAEEAYRRTVEAAVAA